MSQRLYRMLNLKLFAEANQKLSSWLSTVVYSKQDTDDSEKKTYDVFHFHAITSPLTGRASGNLQIAATVYISTDQVNVQTCKTAALPARLLAADKPSTELCFIQKQILFPAYFLSVTMTIIRLMTLDKLPITLNITYSSFMLSRSLLKRAHNLQTAAQVY